MVCMPERELHTHAYSRFFAVNIVTLSAEHTTFTALAEDPEWGLELDWQYAHFLLRAEQESPS